MYATTFSAIFEVRQSLSFIHLLGFTCCGFELATFIFFLGVISLFMDWTVISGFPISLTFP